MYDTIKKCFYISITEFLNKILSSAFGRNSIAVDATMILQKLSAR